MNKYAPQGVDWAQIDRFLLNADKKHGTAQKILELDEEACLQQAWFISRQDAEETLKASSDLIAIIRADIDKRKPGT